ncbi:hypothetical protein HELRODRAFT_177100 [Helobdella robusta]|uniref:Uncharacterized protein n=1 Tax=Helobdella robusta TaxID=6412 RepID=T1FB82_HELRO|nr:hypothetical protein HELRODRAFT_177100 [Helobdella robusta]ESN98223.1 hypothetical protein HELRODRAFT_177100 [Helobdella robusta]
MGDLKAKVGLEKIYDVFGPHGKGERNGREENLSQNDEIKVRYNVEVRNRLRLLIENVNKSKHEILKDALIESSKMIFVTELRKRQKWIAKSIISLINDRYKRLDKTFKKMSI